MITLDGSLGISTPMQGGIIPNEYINSQTGFKNRIINGRMRIAQRGTSATVTAGTTVPTISTGYPCVDRWFIYSVGGNPTVTQVTGAGPDQNQLQITGAASVTQIGVGQRIEQNNSYDLNGSTCTLSVDLSNSLLTTVTWTASYANTIDTFGTIGTPTKTQIATGTFTVTSTLTNYNVQIAIPSAATTGIEILFTVGAQTSGTWVIDDVQLEKSPYPTTYEFRDYGRELIMCKRYYENLTVLQAYYYQVAGSPVMIVTTFGTQKRAVPIIAGGVLTGANITGYAAISDIYGVSMYANATTSGASVFIYTGGHAECEVA